MDTIFAVATGQGRAGVAVIRVSGPRSYDTFEAFGIASTRSRMASLRELKDTDGSILDEALVVLFEENQSFTGESVIELQVHGSQAVVSRCLEILGDQDTFRSAEPGEFTRRAFANGRFDLVQVEGLIDVIDAETEMQRRQAQRLLSGERSEQISEWRDKLIQARSLLEVTIDFADEDVPVDVTDDVAGLLGGVLTELKEQVSGVRGSEIIRNGFEVAIVGPPNAGKSTLLNKITGREIALVSNIPGTTRDIIEARVDLGGLVVIFFDTAGQRKSTDTVEQMGVARARERAKNADLRIFLNDGSGELDIDQIDGDLSCRAKDDAGLHPDGISGETGFGIDRVLGQVQERASSAVSAAGWVANQRQLELMKSAVSFGERAQEHLNQGSVEYDFVSDNIREMSIALASIIGGVHIEAVYDQIFSRFCLGK